MIRDQIASAILARGPVSEDLLVLADALFHYADLPVARNGRCHWARCSIEQCGRCGPILKARAALQKVAGASLWPEVRS